ncbi:hypothetical protein C4569_01285 [Candidatus Parcubacteria bacterium]|nr:MAG: hypothetical protein C4569_01285 [Candidatus Parcubacteria bacterium]
MYDKEIKQLEKNKLKKETFWYSETLAASLILFAKKNKKFCRHFRQQIKQINPRILFEVPIKMEENICLLVPEFEKFAYARADWLLNSLVKNNLPGSFYALNMLYSWGKHENFEVPKQIVVGVLALAIPGITLGRFTKRRKMAIIVSKNYDEISNVEMSKYAAQASLGILSKAFDLAGGFLSEIEPEVADWFFMGRELSFYSASNVVVRDIAYEVSRLGAANYLVEAEDFRFLAVTPVLNNFVLESKWKLRNLNI